jgi:peptide/nickel transport system ATP-binding protein
MPRLIEVQDVKKYFNTPRGMLHAVDGVNFTIDEGETLGVVGESGCGKSTLGRVMLRLLPPTSGKVLFKGQDILQMRNTKELRKEMQIIFQDPFSSLNPRMSLSETIAEPLIIHGLVRSKSEIDDRVAELMETVGLAERFVNSYPHELDGGRRQRIGIARALALDPQFIVCDEPVSALDVSIQAQILNLLQDLQDQRGLTYMFITHDLSVVKHISDNILVMYLGIAVEHSPTKEMFQHPLHPYTQALLSAIPSTDLDARRQRILLRGEITSPIDPAPGCRFATRCNYATDVCFHENPVLEEITERHFVACHNVRQVNSL